MRWFILRSYYMRDEKKYKQWFCWNRKKSICALMRLLFFLFFVLCVFIFSSRRKFILLDNIAGRFFSKWIGFLGWESNQKVVFGLVIGNVFLDILNGLGHIDSFYSGLSS